MNRGSLIALTLVITMGGAFLWQSTDELRAFTTEGARRLAVARQPRELPEALLVDQAGTAFRLQEYRGKRVLVEFIYTRCPTLCSVLGLTFERIARKMPSRRFGKDVFLLSITFDPQHDDAAALSDYAARFSSADGRSWRMARVDDPEQLAGLLQTFGITVIPNEEGGFEHNAAIHLIGPDGRLSRIYEAGAADQVAAELGQEQWPSP